MTFARRTAFLGLLAAAVAARARADEVNLWPAYVLKEDPTGKTLAWSGLGPFLFSGPDPGPYDAHSWGFRPFFVHRVDDETDRTNILYPLFFYRKYPGSYKWSIFDLINHEGISNDVTRAGGPLDRHFDVWPFYFSHETGNPIDTYHALFPIFGTMKYRLGYDQLTWAPFPLYVESVKKKTRTYYTPWPIVRFIEGAENGFALWPLFGMTTGPGPARHSYFIWPLIWDNTVLPGPNDPEGTAPGTQVGFLPFYTREKSPDSISENFLWPFFGYTERRSPDRYSEQRYFWPFLVQGRGDDRIVNRWGPVYTHSDVKGLDSTWLLWPLFHRTKWIDGDIGQEKTQFFYWIYWSQEQRSVSRPGVAHAYKRHVWPVISAWDNGAGSRQVQIPSPLEVFFPDNPDMRDSWTPLFSIYRYDHRPDGETRNSLFWDAITWRHDASRALVEFHVGPILGMRRRTDGTDWTILGFDFGPKLGKDGQANR